MLFLDIRITSAPANAFIFFAQVIPTVFTLDGGGAIHLTEASNKLVRVYTFLYNVWNLQFFQLEICLSIYQSYHSECNRNNLPRSRVPIGVDSCRFAFCQGI